MYHCIHNAGDSENTTNDGTNLNEEFKEVFLGLCVGDSYRGQLVVEHQNILLGCIVRDVVLG